MNKGLDNKKNQVTVGINQLRAEAMNRLDSAQKKLNPNNEIPDASADSTLGGLILSLLTWTPIMHGMGGLGLEGFDRAASLDDSAAHGGALTAAFEGLSTVFDESANKNRGRKLNDYPEGRRKAFFSSKPLNNKFNFAAANENFRFSHDAAAEIASMAEILDMLDVLEKEGVSSIGLDTQGSVHAILKQTVKALKKKNAVRVFSAPMRKFA